MHKSVGETLREIRIVKGISQRALADEVGIHFASISKIERGVESCGESTLRKLAEALDADVELLLGQAGHKTLPYRVLGNIAAGEPIETAEHIETFDLTDHFAPTEHYMLKVRGDSMIRAGINDGDLAIIRHGDAARNGDVIVAIVGDEEATLKTYTKSGRRVTLSPANKRLKPKSYPAKDVEIRGVMVGAVRTKVG